MSLPKFQCPRCGEQKNLKGRRETRSHREREKDVPVHIECQSCGHQWTHDPWLCPGCGAQMDPVREPLLQKARGTQQSIIGYRTVKRCPRCAPPEDRSEGWMSAT